MFNEIDLPPETLHLIFSHLSPRDLLQCVRVSRHWSGVAEAQLYGNITFSRRGFNSYSLIPALRTRKHLLRRFDVRPCEQFKIPESDLLDILLDYRPEHNNKRRLSPGDSYRYPPPDTNPFRDDTKIRPALPKTVLGPNRPALTHFSIVGFFESSWLLDSIIFNLATSTLTSIKIQFYFGPSIKTYMVDLERILETFPHLKDLWIAGYKHQYKPAGVIEDSDTSAPKTATTTTAATSTSVIVDSTSGSGKQYHLESFTFEPTTLLSRRGSDAFMFIRRLGNLKRIGVNALMPYFSHPQTGRPWELGRALQQHCPKLESIDIDGPVPLWFFDLPILPYHKIRHITRLATESLPLNLLEDLGELAQEANWAYRMLRLQEQELGELAEGKSAKPYFPQLKTLVLRGKHCLSAQDLILLGVHGTFLTRLEMVHWSVPDRFILNMYDTGAAAAAAAESSNPPPLSGEMSAVVEERRRWKRRVFNYLHLLMFLQRRSSLRHFAISGDTIPFEHLIDKPIVPRTPDQHMYDDDYDEAAEASAEEKEESLIILPWACEERLETLRLGFQVSASDPREHELVWKHLGRFGNLCSLHLDRSNLFASLSCGLEGLLEGGMSETLEEIRSLPGWWKTKDCRELVLWFSSSFPKLRVLGLAYDKWHVDGKRGKTYCAFLEDEVVKKCSIRRVFIEDAPVEETPW
ncbi:hypothetical protein BKA57DRAFT_455817 [Linnemannia elongata]|nr:hypothetical protein BKA57DRAFT_455817 [Linnemannia elongata]